MSLEPVSLKPDFDIRNGLIVGQGGGIAILIKCSSQNTVWSSDTFVVNEIVYKRILSCFLLAVAVFVLSGCSLIANSGRSDRSISNAVLGSLGLSPTETESESLAPLKGFPSIMPRPAALPPVLVTLNPEVRKELDTYLVKHRYGISDALERRAAYLPMMEEIFRDEGMPLELLALPIVESGFNPSARSPVGARGLWQFMPATARLYGMRVDRKVDERTDPILSTIAAARFLKDLYLEHQDWSLALAAYNAGSGGVNRAMARTGATCYWTLVRSSGRGLTTQTERFVPKFLAAALITRSNSRFDPVELAANKSFIESLADKTPGV